MPSSSSPSQNLSPVGLGGGVFNEATPPPAERMAAVAADPTDFFAALPRDDAREMAGHLPELYRLARRFLRNEDDARDLVQDTCERAVRAFAQFRNGSNMRAWLYTIMARRSQDLFRARRVRAQAPVDPDTLAASEPEEAEESHWCDVSDVQLQNAVARLSPRLRQVFEMHEVHQLPYHDIALHLDIPINTVGTRLRRAREKLRQLLMADLERAGGRS